MSISFVGTSKVIVFRPEIEYYEFRLIGTELYIPSKQAHQQWRKRAKNRQFQKQKIIINFIWNKLLLTWGLGLLWVNISSNKELVEKWTLIRYSPHEPCTCLFINKIWILSFQCRLRYEANSKFVIYLINLCNQTFLFLKKAITYRRVNPNKVYFSIFLRTKNWFHRTSWKWRSTHFDIFLIHRF